MAATENAGLDVRYSKGDRIAFRKIADEGRLVLLDLRNGEFYSLDDAVGVSIFESLMTGATCREVLAQLVGNYPEVGEDQLLADLQEFVGRMTEQKLIVPSSAKPTT